MTSKFRANKNDINKKYLSKIYTAKIRKNKIHFLANRDESFFCFYFALSLSQFSAWPLLTQDIFSTSKSIENSGVDIVGVAAVDVFVTLDWVDTSCWFSDATLELIFDMAPVQVAVVEGLDSSGFSGLFFGILNFLTLFRLLDVLFPAIALVSSFAFKKKATKCEWLLLHEGIGIQRVVFMWGRSKWVDNF